MIDVALADALDAMAQAAFDRGDPAFITALDTWDASCGALQPSEPEFDAWAASRADWALCDGWSREPDDRARLAALTEAAGDHASRARRSIVGLFEVWPGSAPWLRDRIGGICVRAATPLDLVRLGDGPDALWELRVVIEAGAAQAVRPPIDYPRELADLWTETANPDLTAHARLIPALHRGRRRWARTPRHGVRACFAEFLAELTAAPRTRPPA